MAMDLGAAAASKLEGRIFDYLSKHGPDTSFTESFWRKCEPHTYEVGRYPLYVECMRLFREGKSLGEIADKIGVNWQSVNAWTKFKQKPKLAHFLSRYLQFGTPKEGWFWLSVNNTSGHAVPLGPVVEVPLQVSNWGDVATVLAQLKPLETNETELTREYIFGFLIGMIIGDAAKSRAKNWHRHLGLVLSKKYRTNKRIGDFTCFCARDVGLRMHSVADQPKKGRKPHGFYEWVSQASPLVDWIFNVVLGLKDGERTTYDAVRMGWVVESPVDFRRGLIQGIAESDGSVSIASQTVEFWIGPNWEFFKAVLLTFGVRGFQNREALSVTKSQIAKLGVIPPFSPLLKTVRYRRFEKLFTAKHIGHGRRVPLEIRKFILANCHGISVPKLSEKIVDTFGFVLGFEAVQRWMKKGTGAG
ncbi:MAG: hypothetical protein JRM99_00430 [Nitrososphaerota archaeon]|nr:hypothetical protein [Nitrososphaerota archaeon]